jgi:hypothetical protein
MNLRRDAFFQVLILCLLSFAPLVQGQDKANVSGTWKMNREKSTFERGGPGAITIKFDQQGSSLKETLMITNNGNERTANFSYTLDGKEALQEMQGRQIKTAARWEGESLVIEFKNDEGTFVRKFTMAGDKKTMTLDVKQSNPGGAANDVVLLEKQ